MGEIRGGNPYSRYLKRIANHMMRLQDELLAPYHITSQQARVLGGIHTIRQEQGVCCQKDLEGWFGLRGSSITSLLKGLERKGYVTRCSGSEDARRKQLALTAEGERLLDSFLEVFRQSEGIILSGMSEEERETLLRLLERVSDNLE